MTPRKPSLPPDVDRRTPAGQTAVTTFPILHEGPVPTLDVATWTLTLDGLVTREVTLTWADLMALPQVVLVSDFHCVTRWSNFDNAWEGVRFRDLLAAYPVVQPEARYVMEHGHLGNDPRGYTTNVPLDVLMDDDVLLAHSLDGQPLAPAHGWPLRLVVPKRYAWKSTKWLRALTFMAEDRRGYWEQRGYHTNADPWPEERYASQERPEQRMQVRGKD